MDTAVMSSEETVLEKQPQAGLTCYWPLDMAGQNHTFCKAQRAEHSGPGGETSPPLLLRPSPARAKHWAGWQWGD